MREQPKEVRRRFTFIWSTVITGVIVLIWISILFGRSYALKGDTDVVSEDTVPTLETENVRESFDSSNYFLSNDFQDSLDGSIDVSEVGDETASSSTSSEASTTTDDAAPTQDTGTQEAPHEAPLETPPLWP